MNSKRRENPTRKCKKQSAIPGTEETETPKALLNDVVLQNIFKYLGYKDLKSCRQVGNTTWLRNSKKAWWSRTKVVFGDPNRLAEKIPEYLGETEIISNATNYKLQHFIDRFEGNFWERLGPSIKFLEIERGVFHSVDAFRRLLYTQCPNLEKLHLGMLFMETGDRTTIVEPSSWQNPQFGEQRNLKFFKNDCITLPVSWMEFFSHFPNIQVLEGKVVNADVFKAISIIRKHDPKMLKLKECKIFTDFESDQDDDCVRSVLLDRNLSFEGVYINADNCKPETVSDILDLHVATLKEVFIKGDFAPNAELNVPRQSLQVLEDLSVSICHVPMEFFKYTPNLRKICLCQNRITRNQSTPELDFKLNTCKEIELFRNSLESDGPNSDFELFFSLFPNVEILETRDLDNFTFSMICKHFPKLVTFDATSYCEVTVTGLLGYDPDSPAKGGIRKPNITDLKDLQSFSALSKEFWTKEDLTVMKNGSVILKDLEGLRRLKKFELRNYELQGDEQIWKKIFDKYSGK